MKLFIVSQQARAWTRNWTCSCKTLPCILFLEGQQNIWFPSFQLREEVHYKNTPYGSAEGDSGSYSDKGQLVAVIHCRSALMWGSKIVKKGCCQEGVCTGWPTGRQRNKLYYRIKVCTSSNHFTNKQTNKQKYKYMRCIHVKRLMLQGLGSAETELAGN